MAYVGQGNPAGGQAGAVRSQMDPGYLPGSTTPQYNTLPGGTSGGVDPNTLYSQWYSGYMAPSQVLGQAQINELGNQRDLGTLQTALGQQNAQQQAGFSLQDVGLQGQSLGVQQGALARQMQLLPQQYGLQQQQFGVQGKQIDLSETEAWQNAQRQSESLKSQATSSGTWNMPGTSTGFRNIRQDLQNAGTGIGLQRQSLGINEQQAALGFKEQQAQQQDSQKMLGIQSKRLGLSTDEIKSRLQSSLDQLGISNQISVDQLTAEMYKVQQGELSPLQGLFSAIYQTSGINIPAGQTPGAAPGQ